MIWTRESLAKIIDHTNVKPNTNKRNIERLCREAKRYGFRGVCVQPCFVSLAKNLLRETKIKIVTVIGFPFGFNSTKAKVCETKQAIKDGADEIDMVMNIAMLKSKNYKFVEEDIRSVVEAANGKVVKVIIETCYLNKNEKIMACKLVAKAGASFVKTSTGYGTGGATVNDVKLIRKVVGDKLRIKASGGIRTFEQVKALVEAGADVIGTSTGVKIMKDFIKTSSKV